MSLDRKIPPVVVALASLSLVIAFRFSPFPPQGAFVSRPWLALAFALTGCVLAFTALFWFRRRRTTSKPGEGAEPATLVTDGPFRLTRNPMYLGMLFVVLGGWILWPSFAGLTAPALFALWLNRFQIRPEEAQLALLFPKDYPAWAARTRRWL